MALILAIACLSSGDLSADQGRELRPKSWQQDATINDVFFVNRTHGWAVGDQGVILRTTNGGEDWVAGEGIGRDLDGNRSFEDKLARLRPLSQAHELYPLTCSLTSVFFLNERRGWIAGNFNTPYQTSARSVILTTNDGGKSWTQLKNSVLPRINRIYFQDVLGGWALGSAGYLFKSGVFTTSSAGSNWSIADVDPPRNWIDGELAPGGFVVIDDQGILGRIDSGEFEPAVVFGDRPGELRSIRMLSANTGWAAGTGGTIVWTKDGGKTWRQPPALKERQFADFDFSSVSIAGKRVWIAGNPGTFVVSFDARNGEEIKIQATSNLNPITKIHFANERRGWAVGTNGLILRTDDYGKNWEVQRRADERVALLTITDDCSRWPLACLSNLANEQGKLVATAIVGQHDREQIELAGAAVKRLGAAAPIVMSCDDLKQEKPGFDSAKCVENLVRTIRTLRPNVLVCDATSKGAYGNVMGNATSSQLQLACRTAIEMASSSETFPDQLEKTGLNPWQVDRLLIRQEANAQVRFEGVRYLPRSGKLLEDQVAISRGLLGLPPRMQTAESFAIESYVGTVSAQGNDVFFGLAQLGRDIPGRNKTQRMGNLNSIATAPLKQQELRRMMALPSETPEQIALLQNAIRDFATGSEARESGIWLVHLADAFVESGQLEMAAYSLEQLLIRNSHHAFAVGAMKWLTQYYHSDEAAAVILASYEQQQLDLDPDNQNRGPVPKLQRRDGATELTWHESQPDDPERLEESIGGDSDRKRVKDQMLAWRRQKSAGFLHSLLQSDLDQAQSPEMQFLNAMLSAKIPGNTSQDNLLNRIRRTNELESDYVFAAGRELKTRKPEFERLSCVPTTVRPRLDGGLDDEVWQTIQNASSSIIRSVDDRQDHCMLAYDDEFLYLAVRCQRLADADYAATNQVRTRDSELTGKDRIQFVLDIDRDLRSAFVFEIDYRGWASESCCGAKGWNPEWYIAAGGDSESWTLECAIPLKEIALKDIGGSTAAIVLRRLGNHDTDVWAQDGNQKAGSLTGLVASFDIQPRSYELLRFETREETEQTAAVFTKSVK